MSKLCKVLLIWLCALAFPLQGMAAAVMLSCGTSHHQPVVAHEQSVQAHEGREEHHGMGHDHGSGHSADKCSACASCCIGMGMATSLLQWQAESQEPSSWMAIAKLLLPSFMADGLERPPRLPLA